MRTLIPGQAARLVERQIRMHDALRAASAGGPADATKPSTVLPHYVAISRQHFAEASLVSSAVAEMLGWALYDKQLLEAVAEDAHLKSQLVEHLDERELGQVDEILATITGHAGSALHEYNRSLARVLRALGDVGQVVIVGRGAARVLPPELGLAVRLVAPFERRVQRLIAEEGVPAGQAPDRLRQMDRESEGWLKRTFPEPAGGAPLADIELNTGSLGVAACAELIVDALVAKCPDVKLV